MRRKDFLRLSIGAPLAAAFATCLGLAARAATTVRVKKPSKAWEATEFTFEKDGRDYPGLALRVPGADGKPDSIYTACRLCPHESCTFGFETNYQLVGRIIGKELSNPVLFCRCHMSVFDPARGGEVLNGPAKRVPWRFDTVDEGNELHVVALEEGAGEIK